MTFIEATVRATRALNMNAEQVAVFEDFTRVVQCAKRFRPTGTIHGEHANRSEPPLLELAFDALAFEILGFAHEMNHARTSQRQQRVIDDGKMIGCDNGTAFARNVFKSLGSRSHAVDGDRSQAFDEKPVEHFSRSS